MKNCLNHDGQDERIYRIKTNNPNNNGGYMKRVKINSKVAMLVAMFAITFTFNGCATQKFLMEGKDPTIPTYEGTSHFFLYGIGQTNKVNPEEICGSKGINTVETNITFLNGLCQGITYGIYYPMSYKIYCNKE
jgi:hypothetical protein